MSLHSVTTQKNNIVTNYRSCSDDTVSLVPLCFNMTTVKLNTRPLAHMDCKWMIVSPLLAGWAMVHAGTYHLHHLFLVVGVEVGVPLLLGEGVLVEHIL
jgi:hypothetical protein